MAVVYAITGWLLIQIADATFQFLNISDWVARVLIFMVIIGFPIALILARIFAILGDKESAMDCLKKSVQEGRLCEHS